MADGTSFWKRCSSCKQEIDFSTVYWVCSVSTCNRKRTGMIFCSVDCWEVHLPMMRHRESYAVEKRSPSRAKWQSENTAPASSASVSTSASGSAPAAGPAVRRRVAAAVAPEPAVSDSPAGPDEVDGELGDDADLPRDILIIASKLKKYIRARSGMNTSDSVLPTLSDHLRLLCNRAIRNAAEDGRKTVLERDIPRP